MQGRVYSEWFRGGLTNMCFNCLDRHVEVGGWGRWWWLKGGRGWGMRHLLASAGAYLGVARCFASDHAQWGVLGLPRGCRRATAASAASSLRATSRGMRAGPPTKPCSTKCAAW